MYLHLANSENAQSGYTLQQTRPVARFTSYPLPLTVILSFSTVSPGRPLPCVWWVLLEVCLASTRPFRPAG